MVNRLFIILVFMIMFSSCTTFQGSLSSSFINRSVKYEDVAMGIAQIDKYFGFGGLSHEAMVFEARRSLIENRPLKPNEAYANYTIDFKNTYIIFIHSIKVIITADVIKFSDDSTKKPLSDKYASIMINKHSSNELFQIGDSVLEKNLTKGTILSFSTDSTVWFLYKTKNNRFKTNNVSIKEIFTTTKSYKGLKTNDPFTFISMERKVPSKILGLGLNTLLIKVDSNGAIYQIYYSGNLY